MTALLAAATVDNRRATTRTLLYNIIRCLPVFAELHGGDTIAAIVFTGIWTSNVKHLVGQNARYAEQYDIPPDSQRRPIPQEELQRLVAIPPEILHAYVERLVSEGYVERWEGGLAVPAAVFAQPDMLSASNEVYMRLMGLIGDLRGAGFSFGEPR